MYSLIINLKAYDEGANKKAKKLALACKELAALAEKKKVKLVLCPQLFDLQAITQLQVPVFAQHCDPITPGAHTGYTAPANLKAAGASGTLLNHSEHRIPFSKIEETIKIAKKEKIEVCLCARNEKEASKFASLKPTYIAVEPKELIGGDISISSAKPRLISKSLKAVGKVPLLVGAGVKNRKDVEIAVKLGAKGILVASGVVKAKSPKSAIKDLLEGF